MRNLQPKYKIGQKVKVKIETKNALIDKTFTNKFEAFIMTIKASGTSKKDTYEYGLTTDMPGWYNRGKPPFIFQFEDDIEIVE